METPACIPGTNVPVGTEFVAQVHRTGNWFLPRASQAAPGWRRTLERLQEEFREHTRRYRPIRSVLYQRVTPNAVEAPPWPGPHPDELRGSCTGIERQTGQLFSPDGKPLMGEWPVPDVTGKLIATTAGEAIGWRLGFFRYHVTLVSRSHKVGDDRLEADGGHLTRVAMEAGGMLRNLPAGIAANLWRNWPEGFAPPCDEALWLDALYELAWRPNAAGPLSAKAFADAAPHTTIALTGDSHYPQLPPRTPGTFGPPIDRVSSLHGNPYRWHSVLDDLSRASVAAIDILLSLPDGETEPGPNATAVMTNKLGKGKTAVSETGPVKTTYYLLATSEHWIYNFDSTVLGTCVSDPDYIPLGSDQSYFFKVDSREVAERLVRLFTKSFSGMNAATGEEKVRVSFSFHDSRDFDQDETFLIEDAISQAQQAFTREGNDAPLSPACLFQKARSWSQSLSEKDTEKNETYGRATATGEVENETKVEKPDPTILRQFLPTAVVAAVCLRDLARVNYYYPDAISAAESNRLRETLWDAFEGYYGLTGLPKMDELHKRPDFEDVRATEAQMTVVMSVLILHHPDFNDACWGEGTDKAHMADVLKRCQDDAETPVSDIANRLMEASLIDCRIPRPRNDPSYQEPQRYLQMLKKYWQPCREIILTDMSVGVGYRPHRLSPMLINYRDRLSTCCEELKERTGIRKVQDLMMQLLDILLEGDIDGLHVAEEWVTRSLQVIDATLESERLTLGGGHYPLTASEELSLSQSEWAVSEYGSELREVHAGVLRSATQWRAQHAPAAPDGAAKSSSIDRKSEVEQGMPSQCDTSRSSTPSAEISMKPCVAKAWQAYRLAEAKWESPTRMTVRAAWEWLREHGPEEYDVPALGTFSRYVRTAQKVNDERVNHPRAGRTGRSIVAAGAVRDRSRSDLR